jgi:hypothetical protein
MPEVENEKMPRIIVQWRLGAFCGNQKRGRQLNLWITDQIVLAQNVHQDQLPDRSFIRSTDVLRTVRKAALIESSILIVHHLVI